ncbi:MAG TPA: hypothetical protein VJI13_00365 [Candidatus Norongarragalinales archaeon]|nr:hypothetical protein [Candidatus Norongarragalinales archaeon]
MKKKGSRRKKKEKRVPTWEEMQGFLKKKVDLKELVRDRETQWH